MILEDFMIKKAGIPFLFFMLIGTAVNAGNLGIGVQGAWMKPADANSSTFYGGGHLRMRILPWFMLEGAVGYRQEKYLNESTTVKTVPLTVSGMFVLMPGSPFEPYLIFGTGVNFIQVSGAITEQSHSKAGYHAGVGIQLRTGSLSIFGEYRYLGVKFDVNVGEEQSGLQINASGSSFRVGFTFWF